MKKFAEFIPFSINTGKYNMDCDYDILESSIRCSKTHPILRLYGWSPACVSLGRNQNETCVNKDFCLLNNIDIVRRVTGGRALLHDNELTYSFVCPCDFLKNGETVIQSYKEISGAIALGLSYLGINADFPKEKNTGTHFEYCMSLSTGADLSFNNKKIVGSAQFRKQGYILQHGSILLDLDILKIQNIFQELPSFDKIITIKQIDSALTLESLCDSLKLGFEEYFNVSF